MLGLVQQRSGGPSREELERRQHWSVVSQCRGLVASFWLAAREQLARPLFALPRRTRSAPCYQGIPCSSDPMVSNAARSTAVVREGGEVLFYSKKHEMLKRATWSAVVCLGKGQRLVLLEKRCATASPMHSSHISPESHTLLPYYTHGT